MNPPGYYNSNTLDSRRNAGKPSYPEDEHPPPQHPPKITKWHSTNVDDLSFASQPSPVKAKAFGAMISMYEISI